MTGAVEVVQFPRLTAQEASRRIRSRLSKAGIDIEPAALDTLVVLLAGSGGALENEINKLIDFKGAESTVTEPDVRRVVAGYQTFKVFDLADELALGRKAGAMAMMHQLLNEGQSATGLLFILGRHFIGLMLARNGRRLEPSMNWLAGKLMSQARRFTDEQLQAAITTIAEADAELRRSKVRPDIILDRVLLELA
jgi:DNA polymerase-3 subunit delta